MFICHDYCRGTKSCCKRSPQHRGCQFDYLELQLQSSSEDGRIDSLISQRFETWIRYLSGRREFVLDRHDLFLQKSASRSRIRLAFSLLKLFLLFIMVAACTFGGLLLYTTPWPTTLGYKGAAPSLPELANRKREVKNDDNFQGNNFRGNNFLAGTAGSDDEDEDAVPDSSGASEGASKPEHKAVDELQAAFLQEGQMEGSVASNLRIGGGFRSTARKQALARAQAEMMLAQNATAIKASREKGDGFATLVEENAFHKILSFLDLNEGMEPDEHADGEGTPGDSDNEDAAAPEPSPKPEGGKKKKEKKKKHSLSKMQKVVILMGMGLLGGAILATIMVLMIECPKAAASIYRKTEEAMFSFLRSEMLGL
ncbi:unnamed protein product [Amoebophrya sp. A25]|nr:unnamed protein product [Amoebophrya sp. A25]|eukprot:GSA25T00022524001.1